MPVANRASIGLALAARSLAVFAIVEDAKDERAALFCEALGFGPFPLYPNRLFLQASVAGAAL
jgi:hypothetical protein